MDKKQFALLFATMVSIYMAGMGLGPLVAAPSAVP